MVIKCSACAQNLDDRPAIHVEKVIYCYRCAKQTYARIFENQSQELDERFATELKEYESLKAQFIESHGIWHQLRQKEGIPTRLDVWGGACVGAAIAGYGASLITTSLAVIVAPAVLLVLWVYLDIRAKSKDEEFVKNNPKPALRAKPPKRTKPRINLSCPRRRCIDNNPPYEVIRRYVRQRDQSTCQCCERKTHLGELEVHHVIPRSADGHDDPTNLILLCLNCHDRETWFGHVRVNPTTL